MFILDGRQAFYQWDLEQKITSEKFKVGDQIHFANNERSTALVLIAYEYNSQIVVDVPNILLQCDSPITVYRYIKNPDNSHTIEQQDFYVIPRTKPDDYIYTPTEYHTVEKAVQEALTLAKENGDFKGEKGDKGDAGVVRFIPVTELPAENIDESAIYLVPSDVVQYNNTFDEYVYIDGSWEKIGSASVEVNLDEYVKTTDYATSNTAGTVKVANYSSGLVMNGGSLMVASANSNNVIDKTNNRKPLTPSVVDTVVKVGLTTNTETLTEEEKANASEWLGINALTIPNTVSGGGKSITVSDVSPLAHKCTCKLTSDTYEDVVGESNNIFETTSESITIVSAQDGADTALEWVINDNGSITFNGYTECRGHFRADLTDFITAGKTYTFSLRDATGAAPFGEGVVVPYSETGEALEIVLFGGASITFTAPENVSKYTINFDYWGNIEENGDPPYENYTIYPQLELGTEMTDWGEYGGGIIEIKPYVGDFSTVTVTVGDNIYKPNADGTVTDIISVSPTMEITTDNENVNIHDFNYCMDTKSYIDNKFEELKSALIAE